jgi:tetratricopeptide (TPR) repeat protein
MSVGVKRSVAVAVTSLLWLAGCETTSLKAPDFLSWKSNKSPSSDKANSDKDFADTTGTVGAPPAVGDKGPEPDPPLTPGNPNDDLSVGRMNFRQGNYGLAEHYFRRAVETGPREAEAWLGLAASYDRLKRFDLADRAYRQLYAMMGRTPEILNNQGYSYMLRGDFMHARKILTEAQAKDPASPYIANNMALLHESVRTRKAVR